MEGTCGLEDELEKKMVIVEDEKELEHAEEAGCGSGSDSEEDEDSEFEFAFVCRDPDTDEITADELFSNGQIRTAFPLFNRDLLYDDGAAPASSSSGADSSDGGIMLPLRKLLVEDGVVGGGGSGEEGAYCVWTPRSPAVPPSPGQCKKSRSTGSSSRRWRLRDLLHRSSSDGKEAFVFLSAPSPAAAKTAPAVLVKEKGKSGNSHDGPKKKSKKGTRPVSAHEIYLRKRAVGGANGPRYELPYRTGIMGFFSNA